MKLPYFISILTVVLVSSLSTTRATEPDSLQRWIKIDATARIDWQLDRQGGTTVDDNTGFEGKYLMLRFDGELYRDLTYSWRQRLNKIHRDQSFFDATDWLYVNYAIDGWNLRAGKEIVAIGGWEYDRAPYDLYGTSVFWNNVPCYQLGVSAGYNLTPDSRLTFQAVQSPFFTSSKRNLYGYSLMWSGTCGIFKPTYSVNLFEFEKGRYINYISLGNRFRMGHFTLELDLMNRAASGQTFLLKDCSIIGELSYRPNRRWTVVGKMTYDVNRSGTGKDLLVANGTELTMAGGGLEYYPLLRDRTSLRLHAMTYYAWGRNTNAGDVMQNKSFLLQTGITWHMNIFNYNRKH